MPLCVAPGLYDVVGAPLFFGREKLITEFVTYLKDHRCLAVVGACRAAASRLLCMQAFLRRLTGKVLSANLPYHFRFPDDAYYSRQRL